MSNFYNNPENALKRANEFLELGKQDEAVECLYDILKNKKSRIIRETHETVINKLLEICVDRRMSATAKDGLYLYRVLCHDINIKSWENAIRRLISLAEHKIEIATEELFTCDANDFWSLDQTVTPENLLELVSDSCSVTEINRIALFPWIKFNWECYRFCLDLLRSTQVEKFYHYVAQKALNFCLKYHRKAEFRRLCHVLRVHLGYLQKQKSQNFSNINNPEALTLYLETGTVELEIALELELWQEAFKTIENLHFLIGMVKRQGNSKIIVTYYEKLSDVFLKTGDSLYHAAALFRYFSLSRELKKNLSSADTCAMSSAVVLAVLAVPFSPNDPTIDLLAESDASVTEKKHRLLSTLLNFSGKLTRKTLIIDLERYGVVQASQAEIQGLFNLLVNELDPLNLGNRILYHMKAFGESSSLHQECLNQYSSSIINLSVTQLLSQLSKIYETITWSRFMSLVLFSDELYVEWLVVEMARRYDIPVRLDHMNACLRFNTNRFYQSSRNEDGLEAHQLPEDKSVNYLSHVHYSLEKLGRYLEQDYFKADENAVRKRVTEQYWRVLGEDRKGILQRKKIIEKHKEMVENMRLRKEEKEKNLVTAKQLEFEVAEKERLMKEAEQRARQRLIMQQEEIRRKILHEKIEILRKSELGDVVDKLDISELEDLDPEIIFSKHFERVTREKKGFVSRLHKQERTINHMERAKRIEEVLLLAKKYEEDRVVSRREWEEDERRIVEAAFEKRARDVRQKERAHVMKNDLKVFIERIQESKKLKYIKECNDFQDLLAREREKRFRERAIKRKVQRRQEWIEEQKEYENMRVKNQLSSADERETYKVNKQFKEASFQPEAKHGYSRDEPKRFSNDSSKSATKLSKEMCNFSENRTSNKAIYEQCGSSTKHENLPNSPQGDHYFKYRGQSGKRNTSPNKRYEDQNKIIKREYKSVEDVYPISPTKYSKNIGLLSRTQTPNDTNFDQYASGISHRSSQGIALSPHRGKNSSLLDRKYQDQKERGIEPKICINVESTNSPTKLIKRSYLSTDSETVDEASLDRFFFNRSHEISPRKPYLPYKIQKPEKYSVEVDKMSIKYHGKLNKYSDSVCGYSNSKNTLDDREYSDMVEGYRRNNARDFNLYETASNHEKKVTMDLPYNQENSSFGNIRQRDFFSQNTLTTQRVCGRFEYGSSRSSETTLSGVRELEDRPIHTNKNQKYEIKHSCTPWAKLHREGSARKE